jgi:hypothetical protein
MLQAAEAGQGDVIAVHIATPSIGRQCEKDAVVQMLFDDSAGQ